MCSARQKKLEGMLSQRGWPVQRFELTTLNSFRSAIHEAAEQAQQTDQRAIFTLMGLNGLMSEEACALALYEDGAYHAMSCAGFVEVFKPYAGFVEAGPPKLELALLYHSIHCLDNPQTLCHSWRLSCSTAASRCALRLPWFVMLVYRMPWAIEGG